MNNIRQYRNQLRNKRRRNELQLLKQNMRNLIYYQGDSKEQECTLCHQDTWLKCEKVSHVIHLIAAIFTTKHICHLHIETFINKTIEGLQVQPTLLSKIYLTVQRETREVVYRKIFLLVDLLYQHQITQNEILVEEIGSLLRSQFMMNLMDCAFDYNSWSIEGNRNENWEVEIRALCQSFLLNVVERSPWFVSQYLEEYPIFSMIEKTKGQRRVDIISSLANHIFDWGKDYEDNSKHLNAFFQSFNIHLNETKGKTFSLEVFIAILQLSSAFLSYVSDEKFTASLISYIKTNYRLKEQAEDSIESILQRLKMNSTIMQNQSDYTIDIQ